PPQEEMSRPLDPDGLKTYARRIFDALGSATTAAMICLGDRPGLHRGLADGEPVPSAELATRSGLHERWLREWMHQQGAAGVLEHRGDGRFARSGEGVGRLAEGGAPLCCVASVAHRI